MKDHEIILKMIEEVDPNDRSKLDEIDARVWCYLNNYKMIEIRHDESEFDVGTKKRGKYKYTMLFGYADDDGNKPYTRSRDALKAIRPDEWYIDHVGISFMQGGYSCCLWRGKDKELIYSDVFTDPQKVGTEELAELHAIIQAIAYEREQK